MAAIKFITVSQCTDYCSLRRRFGKFAKSLERILVYSCFVLLSSTTTHTPLPTATTPTAVATPHPQKTFFYIIFISTAQLLVCFIPDISAHRK